MSLYRLVFDFVRRHARAYLGSALMLTAISLLIVWIPRQIGRMVDELVSRRNGGAALLGDLALLVVAGIAIYLLRVGWRLKLFAAAYRLGVELRDRLHARLTLHGPEFFQRRRSGELMALATNDIDAVEMASGEALLAAFDGSLTLVIVLAMMTLGVDWRLAAVALIPFPAMAAAFWWIARHIHSNARDALDQFSRLNDQVHESLSGIRTIRALALEEHHGRHFSQLAGQASDTSLRAQKWEAAYEPAVGLCLASSTTLSLAMGGYLVWQGELTVGTLTSFSMYLGQMIWPMFAAGWVLSLVERGKAAWSRLRPVLAEPPQVADEGTRERFDPGAIAIRGLVFRYPGQRRPALDGFELDLPAGAMLGLAGPTGAGKSTLLRLLLRQYAPERGHLGWGDSALAELRLATLRGAIGWVPQEPILFSASIADNIALARPAAGIDEIERVARLAAIHDDVTSFPLGYATPVGERGVTLSGGQRQRIAIARALLADPPLLLLDDALSAVDSETESRILAHLARARRGRSAIVVSHRLSALMDAERIIVLRDGRIAEQGRHPELLAEGGWYAAQWRYQQLQASLEAA